MLKSKCKKCKYLGEKLFLKGDRCYNQKCAVVRSSLATGKKNSKSAKGPQKKSFKNISDYGKKLREKQKLKIIYGLRERQFKKYFKSSKLPLQKLETRLDNIIFRLGFASSRSIARQIVSHGHFVINSRRVNVPSYQVKIDEVISLRPTSLKRNLFKDLKTNLKKYNPPSWLSLDKEKLEGKIKIKPDEKEINSNINLQTIKEFYNK